MRSAQVFDMRRAQLAAKMREAGVRVTEEVRVIDVDGNELLGACCPSSELLYWYFGLPMLPGMEEVIASVCDGRRCDEEPETTKGAADLAAPNAFTSAT